jgi:hypothetical protein
MFKMKNISFEELSINEAENKGYTFAIRNIKKRKKIFYNAAIRKHI